jgi:hypothetical protein
MLITLRKFLILQIVYLSPVMLKAQVTQPKGTPVMQIITDFHLDLNDTAKTTGFGISRAYLGYNYQADDHFTCRMVLNIGTPEELPQPATPRRYAFFREASIAYTGERIKVSFGIATTRHFDYLQKFWGKRLVANEFEVRNRYGYIADLGVVADYRVSDQISVDMAITNGEGYSNIQLDNGVRGAAGITWKPGNQLSFRFYNDIIDQGGLMQYTASLFGGIDNKYINFGASFHYKTNMEMAEGQDVWGVSSTGAIKLPRSYEVFARYDYAGSVKLEGESDPWNYNKDGSFIIFGVQKTISYNFKLALDYQDNIPWSSDMKSTGFIFLNALFRI